MYGVPTKRFNEAFKRNIERFPQDFAFQLTLEEVQNLRSQIATSSFHDVTNPKYGEYGGRRYLPWVFTEHGAVMAANILKGEHAVRMTSLTQHVSGLASVRGVARSAPLPRPLSGSTATLPVVAGEG